MRQCTSVTDGQTDWHHGISARCRPYITSRAKKTTNLTGVVGGGQRESVGQDERVERELIADDRVLGVTAAEPDVEMIDGELRPDCVSVDQTERVADADHTALGIVQVLLPRKQRFL